MGVSQSNDSPTKNFAVISPLHKHPSSNALSEGNRVLSTSTNGWFGAVGSVAIRYGDKRYFEAKCLTNVRIYFGLSRVLNHNGQDIQDSAVVEGSANFDYMWRTTSDNEVYYQGSNQSATTSAVSVNDIVSCTTETNGTVKFYKNGTLIHTFSTTLTDGDVYYPIFSVNGATSTERVQANFGTGDVTQQEDGYTLLEAANLHENDPVSIEDGNTHMQTTIHSGNSSSQTVTQRDRFTGDTAGFTPDWAWIKSRSFGNGANVFDSVRGSDKGLAMFDSGAEDDQRDGVTFSSSGGKGTIAFTGEGDTGDINASSRTYVNHQWLAGGAPTADNTDGQTPTNNSVFRDGAASTTAFPSADIYPTRASINSIAGFSIVSYTGNATDGATLAHGLSSTPSIAFFRKRNTSQWTIHHDGLASGISGGRGLQWDVADGQTNAFGAGYADTFNANTCTLQDGSSSDANVNDSAAYIAYFFTEVSGYSKFRRFEGNGVATTGPFVELGFAPQFLMIKNIDQSGDSFVVYDNVREPNNVVVEMWQPDQAAAAVTSSGFSIDFLSNGFRLRGAEANINKNNQTMIYMAFAEHPFAGSTPATAR